MFPQIRDNQKSKISKRIITTFDFRREVALSGVRVDWIVNSNSVNTMNPTAIEIKAQTPKYLTNTFITAVQKGINKLRGLPDNYNKIMLAAAIDRNTAQALLDLGENFYEVAYHQDNMAIFRADIL